MTNVNRYHGDEGGKTEFARQGKGNLQVQKSIKKKQTDRYRQMNGYGYGQRKIWKKGGKGERQERRKERSKKETKKQRKEGRKEKDKKKRKKKKMKKLKTTREING